MFYEKSMFISKQQEMEHSLIMITNNINHPIKIKIHKQQITQ